MKRTHELEAEHAALTERIELFEDRRDALRTARCPTPETHRHIGGMIEATEAEIHQAKSDRFTVEMILEDRHPSRSAGI
jgi:hypothetical protein